MEHKSLEIRYNAMNITSMEEFAGIRGGAGDFRKDVYFVRLTGVSSSYSDEIEKMDRQLSERSRQGQCIYHRTQAFPRISRSEDVAYYSDRCDEWKASGCSRVNIRTISEDRSELSRNAAEACRIAAELYRKHNAKVNEHMERNFVVKLLFWLDEVSGKLLEQWDLKKSMKFAAENIVKDQEYLFCYLLTRLGIDVLLLQCSSDIDERLNALGFSSIFRLGNFQNISLKAYDAERYGARVKEGQDSARLQAASCGVSSVHTSGSGASDTFHVSEAPDFGRISSGSDVARDALGRSGTAGFAGTAGTAGSVRAADSSGIRVSVSRPSAGSSLKREKEFEDLALLASSVVMISVHGLNQDVVATGSGIMIGRGGYILTNHHVIAAGGQVYSVRIENEDQVYLTDEIIKYNPMLDLAVIRIDRTLEPLPVYGGEKALVRGQKVVAIGSPLGMFNSVSDGIISGFRQFDTVNMIQFTAPVSHGSSGGALLNMYGEVIGIITAGIDQGQNINLAVGYEFINTFTNGFR